MLKELSQRRVFRVVSGYAIVCFVVLQIADVTFEPLGISDEVLRAVIAIMLIALPIVAYLAWIFDVGEHAEIRFQPSRPWLEAGVTAVSVCALFLGAWWLLFKPTPEISSEIAAAPVLTEIRSIAVLPLANLSGDASQDYFSQGTTEMLIQDLGKVSSLRVSSRQSVLRYATSTQSAREIADELGVDALLTGSIIQSGERIQLNVQLYEPRSDNNMWAERYDREITDILALQNNIARTVARHLNVRLSGTETAALSSSREVDPESHKAYLLGRFQIARGEYSQAYGQFDRAAKLDATNADAFAELARITNIFFWSGGARDELMPLIRDFNQQALAIDPNHSHALATNTLLVAFEDGNYQESIDRFNDLLSDFPNDFYVQLYYAFVLEVVGQLELTKQIYSKIIDLDPFNAGQTLNLGETYFQLGDYERALEFFQLAETLGLQAPLSFAQLAIAQGDIQALEAQLERDNNEWSEGMAIWRPIVEAYLTRSENAEHGFLGNKSTCDNEDDASSWFFLSFVARSINDTESAIRCYDRALQNREPQALMKAIGFGGELAQYPEFFGHPEYLEMLKRHGLDPVSISKIRVPPLAP